MSLWHGAAAFSDVSIARHAAEAVVAEYLGTVVQVDPIKPV
jgi:hypothetical protein